MTLAHALSPIPDDTAPPQATPNTGTLSASKQPYTGPSESTGDLAYAPRHNVHDDAHSDTDTDPGTFVPDRERSPPPQYPASEAPSSPRPPPPPFSSLFSSSPPHPADVVNDGTHQQPHHHHQRHCSGRFAVASLASEGEASSCAPAYTPLESDTFDPDQTVPRAFRLDPVVETKHALPHDTKSSRKDSDDSEPPPAYEEGDSPLLSFAYVMAAAGGASSIITQVQQGGPPVNAIGGEMRRWPSLGARFADERN